MIKIHGNGQWSMQKSDDTHKYQKDWIIPNRDKGHLWCLAIVSNDNKNWSLLEWVNFSKVSQEELSKAIDMGYMTMLEAMKKFDYEYVIAPHEFDPKKLEEGYWSGLMSGRESKGKTSIPAGELKIDKKEFEDEVHRLVSKIDYKGSK